MKKKRYPLEAGLIYFDKGEKYICIKKDDGITVGKIYVSAIESLNSFLFIIDDSGHRYFYPKENFEKLSEFREKKINEILR